MTLLVYIQHDLTPRIYVLCKSKTSAKSPNCVKFMSSINWKFREEVHEKEWSNWQLAGITDRGINVFQFFSFASYIFILL